MELVIPGVEGPFVDPRHARPDYVTYRAQLERARDLGLCPFCPGPPDASPIFQELCAASASWFAAPHSFDKAGGGRFVYPLREHLNDLRELTPPQFADLFTLGGAVTKQEWRILMLRFGKWTPEGKNSSTMSILHLHGHTWNEESVRAGAGLYPGDEAANARPAMELSILPDNEGQDSVVTYWEKTRHASTHPGVRVHASWTPYINPDDTERQLYSALFREVRDEIGLHQGGILVVLRGPASSGTGERIQAHLVSIANDGEDFAFLSLRATQG